MAHLFCEILERLRIVGQTTGDSYHFPLTQQEQIAGALKDGGAGVDFVALDSPQGHDAFLVDLPRFDAAIRGFLTG